MRWRTKASGTTPADWCLEWRRLKRSFNRVCRATECGSTLRGTTQPLLIGASRRSDTTVPRVLSHTREVRVGEQTLQQACSQEYPGSARCVQSFDDSLDSAIRITYRISLRSSSMWEPRHPSLKVVLNSVCPRRRWRIASPPR